MEQYTDDERVEDLKKWWKENGASILVGIALGLVAIFGWRYWTSYRDASAEQASQAYDAFLAQAGKPDAEPARQQGQALLGAFAQSPYAALTALRLAQLAATGGDYAAASQQLEWVIANARLEELKDIARLRLARIKFAAGQPAEAEKLVESVSSASLKAEREELKGDLYLAAQQPEQARAAYVAAMAANGQRFLQLKLDNLTVATAETVVAAPSTPPPAPEPAPAPAVTPEPAAAIPAQPVTEAAPPSTSAAPTAPATEPPAAAPASTATEPSTAQPAVPVGEPAASAPAVLPAAPAILLPPASEQ